MQLLPIHGAWPLPLSTAMMLVSACIPAASRATIHVIAHDYAFTAPKAAPPGPTTLTFENRGTKQHELLIGLLRPGVASAEILAAHQQGVGFRQLQNVYLDGEVSAALFAWPGKTSPASVTFDLRRGRSYVLFCQLRDSTGMPQHAALGMFHVLRVE